MAGQYAREKQEILRDLRNYRAAEAPAKLRLGSQEPSAPAEAPTKPTYSPRPPRAS
jgi:hypothetical protein